MLSDTIKNFPLNHIGSLIRCLHQFNNNEWNRIASFLGSKYYFHRYMIKIDNTWSEGSKTTAYYLFKQIIYNNCIYYKLEVDVYDVINSKKMYFGNYRLTEHKSTLAEKNVKLRNLNLMIV